MNGTATQLSRSCSIHPHTCLTRGTANLNLICHLFVTCNRTKWKRQATVGIELLAEAGNLAAMQSLCRAGGGGPWLPMAAHPILAHQIDLYYRSQMAAASALQRPPPLPSLSHSKLLLNPLVESEAAAATKVEAAAVGGSLGNLEETPLMAVPTTAESTSSDS